MKPVSMRYHLHADAEPEPLDWLALRRGQDVAGRAGGAPSRTLVVTGASTCSYRDMCALSQAGREHDARVAVGSTLTGELAKLLVAWSPTVVIAELENARRQLDGLAALPHGWNGPGSHEVPRETVETVRRHLVRFERALRNLGHGVGCGRPWLAASEDGSLGIDWQCESRRLAITYDVSGTADFYAQGPDFERDGELSSDADIERIATWIFTGQWRA